MKKLFLILLLAVVTGESASIIYSPQLGTSWKGITLK